VYILDRYARGKPLYESWLPALSLPSEIVNAYDLSWEPPPDAGIVITAQHYMAPEVSILRRLTEGNRVPVLILSDGILEYRNTWLRPDTSPGCIFQPVLGHKVACLGRSQARTLESWGNLCKCEVVGAPRLDALHGRSPRTRGSGQPTRVLILTAKVPGFTPEQIECVKQSLLDTKVWFERRRSVGRTEVRPVWRVTAGLEREIGVQNELKDMRGPELADVLQQVDAVIATPSTAMLEGMLQGVPVALLDYNNCPHCVPAGWTITAPQHVDQVIPELLDPPAAKMLCQDTILHDALECRSPATPRMVRLVEEMVRIGQACRLRNAPLELPRRILHDEQDDHHMPEERFDLRTLYPEHPVFDNMDRAALQVELAQLHRHVLQLSRECAALRKLPERIEAHPVAGPALRLRRKLHHLLRRMRPRAA
jgi:hypothetical protein